MRVQKDVSSRHEYVKAKRAQRRTMNLKRKKPK